MIIPVNVAINCAITSTDVIHSWSVPQLGIKVDAIPGRVNNVMLHTFIESIFTGQCSELCGVKHGFMPIVVESVPLNQFMD
jgi:cytochrome c oxidase subunit 2